MAIRRARQLLDEALGKLAETREELESTSSNLEDWAKAVKEIAATPSAG